MTHFLTLCTWKAKPVSPSQRYSCDSLSAQDFTCFGFSLAKFCYYKVVCRHRKEDLAMHKLTLMITEARCHVA